MERQLSRRDALRAGGVVALGSLAGCSVSILGSGRPDWTVAALDVADGTERWTASSEGFVDGGLALADGTLFALGDFGLRALAVEDGSRQWRFEFESLVTTRAAPVVAGGDVYIAVDYWVGCLAAAEGSERWRFETDAETAVTTAPVRAGDAVVFGCEDGRVYAVEAADGTERWRVDAGEKIESRPGVGEELVVVGTNSGLALALEVADGSERWRLQTPAGGTIGISPQISVADGVAYVSSPDGKVLALATAGGATRWEFPTSRLLPLTIHDGSGYGGHDASSIDDDSDGRVLRLDLSDGSVTWSERTEKSLGGPVPTAPAVSGDVACYPMFGEGLHAFSTADGTRQWRYNPGAEFVRPRATDDTVFVGTS